MPAALKCDGPGERMEGTQGQPEQALGIGQPITRRDILRRAAVLGGSSFLASGSFGESIAPATQPQDQFPYYPPALTGLRGDHAGSF